MKLKGFNSKYWERFLAVLMATVFTISAATLVGCVGAWLLGVPMIKGVVAALISPVLIFLWAGMKEAISNR